MTPLRENEGSDRCEQLGPARPLVRDLRRVASIMSLLACGGFVVLWVRSTTWRDSYYWALSNRDTVLRIDAHNGSFQMTRLGVLPFMTPEEKGMMEPGRSIYSERITDDNRGQYELKEPLFHYGFAFEARERVNHVAFPFWFLTLVSGVACVCLRRGPLYHFNIRDALVLTTFVAVVLRACIAVR